MKGKEIERKWLVTGWPTGLILKEHHLVHQGYLYVNEEAEVRMIARFDFDTYNAMYSAPNKLKLTIKLGNGLVRDEHEVVLQPEQFQRLAQGICGEPIIKEFRIYEQPIAPFQTGCGVIEISHVDPGSKSGFMYHEVEFASETAANVYEPCDSIRAILDHEVTGDSYWNMKNYWLRTR